MNTKKKITILLAVSLVVWVGSYFLRHSYDLGFCTADYDNQIFDVSCHDFFESLGDPLFYSMPALAVVFLFLLFIPRAFGVWKKLAIWFIPLAALLFAVYPYPGPGDFFSPYPEQVYQWVSSLYVVICLGIIGVQTLRSKQ